jgi:DNA helicase-2/ATP-dependent DNA helicase PcrA
MYGRAMGLGPDFTVMDQGDAADLMNLIRNELGLAKGNRRFPRKQTLVSVYSRAVNAQEKLGAVLKERFPWCQDDREGIARIFEIYTRRKREHNLLDYDDLLLMWNALAAAPDVGEKVSDRFEHILVDEYQDTNSIQSQILQNMRKRVRNIMVVGDDAQSIYSFRAATVRNILDFPDQFENTRVVTLEQNYRSTQPILEASNAVMQDAAERYTKDLWSERASDQRPVLLHCLDESNQCEAVCRNILGHLEEGIPLHSQSVLFRAGHHSDMLEVELARRNIPFHKYGGLKFIEAAHVKDLLALLRILENPSDQISWFRVLLLLDGIGPVYARRIMGELGVGRADAPQDDSAPDTSPLQRLASDPPAVPRAAREQFADLRDAFTACTGIEEQAPHQEGPAPAEGPPVAVQVERMRAFYEPVLGRMYENPKVRVRDLEQLEQIAAGYRSRSRFITDLTLDPPRATSDLAQAPYLEEDFLVLSTIHSAKGCEWDVVHILHAADGMIPSDMAISDEAGVDEERRLFYVAMTRAKDMLYVYFPLRYYHRRFGLSDAHGFAQLTRFLPRRTHTLLEHRTAYTADPAEEPAGPFDIRNVDASISDLWSD